MAAMQEGTSGKSTGPAYNFGPSGNQYLMQNFGTLYRVSAFTATIPFVIGFLFSLLIASVLLPEKAVQWFLILLLISMAVLNYDAVAK